MSDHVREALFKMGVEISEDWTLVDAEVKRDVRETASAEPDVYGNTYTQISVHGTRVTISLYRPEN